MNIERIDIYHVRNPLLYPWRTSYGSDSCGESIIVRMTSGGLEGYGESSPLAAPCYSAEFSSGVFVALRDWLGPRLIGQDILSGEALQERLSLFKGNPFAKAALDTAWWDLYSKSLGQPLYGVIGGKRNTFTTGADFGIRDSLDDLLDQVRGAVDAGAPRVKLKYAPGWDLPIVEKVRETFPDATLHIDCNSGYTLADRAMFTRLDQLDLAMFEQPLRYDDLIDHAQLQSEVRTPICLDESIDSPARARHAVQLGSCRWVNVKPGRVGGLTNAILIHDICSDAGIPCWVGGMLESAVGAMHCAALATLPNFTYPNDVFPSDRFFAEDISEPATSYSAPYTFTLPSGPGVGATPDPRRLRACTVQHATLGGSSKAR